MELPTITMAANVGIVFTMLLSISLPIALCFIFGRLKGVRTSSFLLGCATFVLFALILEQLLHTLVFGLFGAQLSANIWLYALYAGLAAGAFEETGRYVAMRFVMRKHLDGPNALMYGAGHGGIEAVMLVGINYINLFINSIMLGNGKMSQAIAQMDDTAAAAALQNLADLAALPAYQFYIAGIERVIAVALHIALSVIVFRAVVNRRPGYLFLSIAIHSAVNFLAVTISRLGSIVLSEIAAGLGALVAVIIAYKLYTGRLPWQKRAETPQQDIETN